MSKFSKLFDLRPPRPGAPLLSNLQQFISQQGGSGMLLLVATLAALLWANSPFASQYESLWKTHLAIRLGPWGLDMSLHHWINDGLMVIFFFVVGLEIKRELLVGELSKPRQALFPIVAALGGMLVPALFYNAFNQNTAAAHAWAIPMATDIAFALGILSLLGNRVPYSLKVFLTAVAIVDDLGAVLVIALFYSDPLVLNSLLAAGLIFVVLLGLNRLSLRHPLPYGLLGILLWLAVLQSGMHATIAGVLLALTIPVNPRIDGQNFLLRARKNLARFEEAGHLGKDIMTNSEQRSAVRELERAAESVTSPLQRLEYSLHPWVAYAVMPLFALANAGVSDLAAQASRLSTPVGLGIVSGLVLGKQIGITLFAWGFTRLGWASRPRGLSWAHVYGGAWLGGIGFTMSLFITNLAFSDAGPAEAARVSILVASTLAALGGSGVLLWLGRKQRVQ